MKKACLNNISKYRNVLFGIAIISIMIHHWCENYVAVYDSGLLWMLAEVYVLLIGSIGVEIFLFLSGIGLCYSLKKDNSVKRFYKRRLLRILPSYVIGGGYLLDRGRYYPAERKFHKCNI